MWSAKVLATKAAKDAADTGSGTGHSGSGQVGLNAPIVTITDANHFRRCTVTLSSAPPDGSGGWSVQFTRNGSAFTSADSAAPYTQTAVVTTGLWTFGATWTKGGHNVVTLKAPSVMANCR